LLDAIIVVQKNNGPYFLKDNYPDKCVKGACIRPVIYTRLGDRNTAINEAATFNQTETLWRKRFGLLYNIEEKAVKYIYDIDNWKYIDRNGERNPIYYYNGDPAYTISVDDTDITDRMASIFSKYFYLCTFLNVSYHPGIQYENIFLKYNELCLFDGFIASVDEGRTNVVNNYGYFIKGTLQHGLYEFIFHYMCGNYSDEAKGQIERVIPIYENDDEKAVFENYAKSKGWCQYSFLGTHHSEFKATIERCHVETPEVISGGLSRNIEQLLAEQRDGKLFNFYNETAFSQSEQTEISHKIREGFVLVEMLKKWRRRPDD
jgi:hypothetical protein